MLAHISRPTLGAAIILTVVVIAAIVPSYLNGSGQDDFKVLYAAAIADEQGKNPYDTTELSIALGERVFLPYVYPPAALFVFKPFTWLGLRLAGVIFLTLKLLTFLLVLYLLYRIFPFKEHLALFLIVIPFAFNGTVLADFRAGNISVFEQALIWLGFYFYLKRKPAYFAALILIAASFKFTPILLLGLLFLGFRKQEIRIALLFLMLFLLTIGLYAVLSPALFSAFIDNAAHVNTLGMAGERGEFNPSTLQLSNDIIAWIGQAAGRIFPAALPVILYAAVCCIVLLITVRVTLRLRGAESVQADILRICLICFSYAVLVPRLKNYSYILLIGPALYTLILYARKNSLLPLACGILLIFTYRDFGIFGSLLTPFYRVQGEYFSLLLAWGLWGLCCYVCLSLSRSNEKLSGSAAGIARI